ncbi:MAG: hypothetical protein J1E58_01600 [Prevotella sp.]|nr:hypothetical protein [Prevotella sp.]
MQSDFSGNKKIAINTIVIYIRMMLVALISFFTTRYVLAALGVSDYGLYNVVGGVVTMLNFVSIAMITTTRRYVNVEMGKRDGDVNHVFNVCLVLHIGFAVFIYLLAITLGLWYINNVLNVTSDKLSDARFVYFISTTVSALGIINVPYQALMTAYERFRQIAVIDFISACLKVPLVIALVFYTGNHLRFYAVGVCLITLCSLVAYSSYCRWQFTDVVKWNFNRRSPLYKEILLFNNYTALGAFAYLARSQGSTMVINFFFGTIVNGAYAIALQIENQIQSFVGNLGTASTPQMTQSYSAGDFQRSFYLVCKITRFSALMMIMLTFSLFVELEMLLGIWLKSVPDNAVLFSQAMLFSLLVRSFSSGIDGLIQATGKVKWYQIIQSTLLVVAIPLSVFLFVIGMPAVSIIFAFMLCDIVRTVAMFIIICRITDFDFKRFIVTTYMPLAKVMMVLAVFYLCYTTLPLSNLYMQILGFCITLAVSTMVCMFWGMTKHERSKITEVLVPKK